MEQVEKTNKLGTAPVRRLMLSMGIPMILSMVLQAFYNIVDSAFVSNMKENGEAALNALTLAFPLQMLMVAVGIGTGVGVNALASKSLGAGEKDRASKAAGNAVFCAAVIYILFLLFGIFAAESYISSQTSNQSINVMATDYLRICCIFSVGIIFFSIYEKLLQASGHSTYSTIAQVAGAITNIILDPIMIYGLIGCPEMGVNGAAYATVIGQTVSFVLALIFHIKVNKDISNSPKNFIPNRKIILGIYSIGMPAIIAQALMSVMTYGLNIVFKSVSESLVTAYGLYYKIQQFILFAAFGLRDAITPIVSFNHGMRSGKRIKSSIKCGLLFTVVIMLAGFIVIEIFARQFAGVFGLSDETLELFIGAMRIVSLSFVFAGANVAFQGIFQALDSGIPSLVISLCRQLIFIFPFALLFAHIAKDSPDYSWTVWTTFPIAEILTCIAAILLFRKIYKTKVEPIM